jgi:ribosome-associated translation inhibitor RaiA
MQIRVNSDSSVEVRREVTEQVEAAVAGALDRFREQITRVEAHLTDENSHKGGGNDKRCALEARLKGLQPIAVTHQAATLDQAVAGAAAKLKKSIENTIGRLRSR